jgi:hypothetical protein
LIKQGLQILNMWLLIIRIDNENAIDGNFFKPKMIILF